MEDMHGGGIVASRSIVEDRDFVDCKFRREKGDASVGAELMTGRAGGTAGFRTVSPKCSDYRLFRRLEKSSLLSRLPSIVAEMA